MPCLDYLVRSEHLSVSPCNDLIQDVLSALTYEARCSQAEDRPGQISGTLLFGCHQRRVMPFQALTLILRSSLITLLACTGFHFFKSLYQSLSHPHHQSQSVHRDVERVSVMLHVPMITTYRYPYTIFREGKEQRVGGDAIALALEISQGFLQQQTT